MQRTQKIESQSIQLKENKIEENSGSIVKVGRFESVAGRKRLFNEFHSTMDRRDLYYH